MASGLQLSRDELGGRLPADADRSAIFEERCTPNSPPATSRASSISMPARRPPASASACISTTATPSPRPTAATAIASPRAATLDGMMHEIFGRKDGLCGGKGGSMHIADLSKGMLGANGIVGAGAPLVCGAALTAKTLKTGGVGVCFYGDGASNQGAVLESYNLAKIWNLPMVFVAEDNGYAEVDRLELVGRRQPGRPRQRLRHPLARGRRVGLLRGLRGGGRGDRAGAGRRRAVAAAHDSSTASTATSRATR